MDNECPDTMSETRRPEISEPFVYTSRIDIEFSLSIVFSRHVTESINIVKLPLLAS